MKLYYAPGACSLASHILALEAGLALDLVRVDLRAKKTESGGDYLAVNPKGYVPTLLLDGGESLTESAVVLQYLADLDPALGLAPPAGTLARYHMQEWLNFTASELHKAYGPLWNPAASPDAKDGARAQLAKRFAWLDQQLDGRPFLMGDAFTAADCYAFVVLGWTAIHAIDMSGYPNLRAYMERIAARPAVRQALKEEGLG